MAITLQVKGLFGLGKIESIETLRPNDQVSQQITPGLSETYIAETPARLLVVSDLDDPESFGTVLEGEDINAARLSLRGPGFLRRTLITYVAD